MKKLTSNKLFLPCLISILDVLFWVLFIIFNVVYKNSIDWNAYNDALKIDADVNIEMFYLGLHSYVFLFFGFLFMVSGIIGSIYMMVEWFKYILYKVDKRMDEKHES